MYGRNIWGGTSHWSTKIGQYRWWWDYIEYIKGDKDKVPITTSVIKKLGYGKTCEEILEKNQCDYVSETRTLYSKGTVLQRTKKNVKSAPLELFKLSQEHDGEAINLSTNIRCWNIIKTDNKNIAPAYECGGVDKYLNTKKIFGEITSKEISVIKARWD